MAQERSLIFPGASRDEEKNIFSTLTPVPTRASTSASSTSSKKSVICYFYASCSSFWPLGRGEGQVEEIAV
jgi:hypothetical protein